MTLVSGSVGRSVFISRVVRVGVALLAAVTTMSLAACADEEPRVETHSYGIVLGERSNSVVPAVEEVVDKLPSDLAPGAKVVIYRVDGSNAGLRLFDETVERTDDFDQADASAQVPVDARRKLEQEPSAGEPEANVLGSIASVANSLGDVSGAKTLLIADSMLSTAGVLQFQKGLLDSSAEDVVASVNPDELPDLSGIDVEVYGAGEVRDPQKSLSVGQRKKLEAIWTDLLEVAKARSVTFHTQLGSRTDVPKLPPVTVVLISQSIASPAPPAYTSECTYVLPESLIQFVPDSADFLEPEIALSTIDGVADNMRGCQGTITVTGTTSSWGTVEGRQQTSQERAERVRDELASALGVDSSAIIARGVGVDFPEYVNDRDASGRLIPADAAKNRTVRITAAV